jgi:hypothetical protein
LVRDAVDQAAAVAPAVACVPVAPVRLPAADALGIIL